MAISFDYDLGETVRIDGRDMLLRKAVAEYIEFAKSPRSRRSKVPEWVRAEGKKPRVLEVIPMDQLAALPIFGKLAR
jgi:hypothetical protein